MTEREAINEVLININELPLDDTDIVSDVAIAVIVSNFLNTARKSILKKGWNFNTLELDLYPNTENIIVIPTSYLVVDPKEDSLNYVVRDSKLFDKTNNSYLFYSAVSCEVIEDTVFDDIAFTVADYIVKYTVLNVYSNLIGDATGINFRASSLKESKIDALREDANSQDGYINKGTFITTLIDRTSN